MSRAAFIKSNASFCSLVKLALGWKPKTRGSVIGGKPFMVSRTENINDDGHEGIQKALQSS